jgi:glycosyltransferase involved in cell wall biosynthesis
VLQSRYCKAIGLLDSGVVKKLQNKIQNKPVTAFPDVTDTSLSSKDAKLLAQIRKKVNGRKIVGVLGSMDRRKGVMAMLRLAKIQKGKNLFYIFAGELNKDKFTKNELAFFQATINTNPDNCFFYLKRIPSEGQFNSFLSICDVIYLSYLDFPHSSNLLTKASFFRKSVVVSRGYYMEEVVKKYKLGISIKQNDENEAYEAVRTLLEGRGFEQTGFKKFYDKNSVANLEKVLRKMIESLNQEYENSIR